MATHRLRSAIAPIGLLVALSGCGAEQVGTYFDVTVQTSTDAGGNLQDTCNDPPEPYRADFTYRVVLSGGDAAIYVGDDLLATGSLDVCALTYQSATWATKRDDGTVRWAILGDAVVGLGGGCAEGWDGSERIQVVEASAGANVPPGCVVQYDVVGEYSHTVE